jgi:hypothetical protein
VILSVDVTRYLVCFSYIDLHPSSAAFSFKPLNLTSLESKIHFKSTAKMKLTIFGFTILALLHSFISANPVANPVANAVADPVANPVAVANAIAIAEASPKLQPVPQV